MKKLLLLIFLSLSLFAKQGTVAVAIPPLQYAAEKIILGKMRIFSLFDEEYYHYQPTRKKVRSIAGMSAYFTLNLPREKPILSKLKEINPKLNVIDLTKELELIRKDGEVNPYVWLDPVLYRKMVERIHEEIVKIDPFNKNFFDANLDNLIYEIDEAFFDMKKRIYATTQENFFVYDDFWDYYAKRYNLNLFKQKKELVKAKQIIPLIKVARENKIKKLLVAPQDNKYYAQSLASKTATKIVEHNIFSKNWESSLFVLTKELME